MSGDLLNKVWANMLYQRAFREELRILSSISNCPICILHYNFWTNWGSDLFSTSKWPSEPQFCEIYLCSCRKLARNGQKMAILAGGWGWLPINDEYAALLWKLFVLLYTLLIRLLSLSMAMLGPWDKNSYKKVRCPLLQRHSYQEPLSRFGK